MTENEKVKMRVEKILSAILSNRYGCKVTLHFEKRSTNEARKEANG